MERIDDLQVNNLKLIQDEDYFCFGCDSVELANFVRARKGDRAIDLGAGNGIISVLLAGKKGIRTTAVEIDSHLSSLIERNIELNNLSSLINVINLPIQRLRERIKSGEMNIVVTNPPYFKLDSGFKGKKASSRYELFITQRELVEVSSYLLNDGGQFYIVYPINRLAELISTLIEFKLEPKELVVLNALNKEPHLFLLRCIKNGKTGLRVTARKIKDYGME